MRQVTHVQVTAGAVIVSLHYFDHCVTGSVDLYYSEVDVFCCEDLHLFLNLEAIRRPIGEVVTAVGHSIDVLAVSGCIANHKGLLDGVVHPFQVKSFVQTSLNILGHVCAACCLCLADKIFYKLNVFCELLNCKSLAVLDVAVSNE